MDNMDQLNTDLRMLVEHHLEDHDELGEAARRTFELWKAFGDEILPPLMQVRAIQKSLRTIMRVPEGASIIDTARTMVRRADAAGVQF